jgi:hypothetical protein
MENKFYSWCVFLRIIDEHDSKLSLTNLAVIITLVKLICAPAVSITDIGALLISLASYAGKKVINNANSETPEDTLTPQIEAVKAELDGMKSQVSTMALNVGLTKLK